MSPKIRVLVVDDSVVFRTQIRAALERSPHIEVVGAANHGKIALQKLGQASVDVVTLDMEMPEMDGLQTIREIKAAGFKVRIIIFSAQTKRGSEGALEALSLGADDFVAKPDVSTDTASSPAELIGNELIPKVLQFQHREVQDARPNPSVSLPPAQTFNTATKKSLTNFKPSIIVIGSSTGGPQALEKVLASFEAPLRCPILIAQHMPPVFTASLAKRLEVCSKIPSGEGKHNEVLESNRIYVAPGDFHMKLVKVGAEMRIHLNQEPHRNSVRPAVDTLFESAAEIFRANCFGVILTGMGEDGRLGCRSIRANGGAVAIQDKESCVVFGMPGAVFNEDMFDQMAEPAELNAVIRRMESL